MLLVLGGRLATAQPIYNQWYDVNNGFAKCPTIGQSAGLATWQRDDFDVLGLFHKRGETYAYIQYGQNGSNTGGCSAGIFRHDTLQDRWFKVAEDIPRAYDRYLLVSNEAGIWVLSAGDVFEQTNDYARFPTGWKKVNKLKLMNDQVFPAACSPSRPSETYPFGGGMNAEADAINDTIYVVMRATESGACPEENRIGKFCVSSATWTFDKVGRFPMQPNYPGVPASAERDGSDRIYFTSRIAGMFKYFYSSRRLGQNKCIPYYVWVFDPRINQWRNISQGINWMNATGNSNPEQCVTTTRPANNWGPSGGFYPSWNRRDIYASSESGLFKWNGSSWLYVADYREGSSVIPTENGIFTNRRSGIEQLQRTNYVSVGDPFNPQCVHNERQMLMSPDDGKSLYVVKHGMKNPAICDWSGSAKTDVGIARLKFNPDIPSRTRNLHVETATYLGGAGTNKSVGVGVGARHHLFVAGNYQVVNQRRNAGLRNINVPGGSPANRAKILRMNTFGDSILSVTNLGGDNVTDYEMQNYGDYRMVVSGDFGVSVIDSGGNLVWNKPSAQIPGSTPKINVDIDDAGRVTVVRGTFERSADIQNADMAQFDPAGNQITDWFPVGRGNARNFNDVAMVGDTVFAVGWSQKNHEMDDFICGSPTTVIHEIKVGWVNTYVRNGRTFNLLHKTYDFHGSTINLDLADTYVHKVNIGKDNKLYIAGESAGGNTIFRWNGKTNLEIANCGQPASTNVSTDEGNSLYQTNSAEFGMFAQVDKRTGVVNKCSYLIPRLNTGYGNTCVVSNGYIHADAQGYVYVGHTSTFKLSGRDIQHLNGSLVGEYNNGDMAIAMIDPSFRQRTFWGTFSDRRMGSGVISGIGIRDNVIAAAGTSRGYMITGSSRSGRFVRADAINPEPFNPTSSNSVDSYLAVWYQDVWNQSVRDTLDERENPSVPIIDTSAYGRRPDFRASPRVVCTGQPVVFANTSVGDSINHRWNFGPGASLLPGTTGRGPHTVTYSTPGYKLARLDVTLKGNIRDYEEKIGYINVLPRSNALGAITGPNIMCSGTEVVYSVPRIEGVTRYIWTFPNGFTTLQGIDASSIRVLTGGTGGTVTVTAQTPCGPSSTSQMQVRVTAPDERGALLVVGTMPLTTADVAIRTRLQAGGLTVTEVLDSLTSSAQAACVKLVMVSPTARAAKVNFKFREVTTPVIVSNPALFHYMSYTNSSTSAWGYEAGQQIQVLNNTHELGVTVPMGLRPAYTAAAQLGWGVPAGNAIRIAASPTVPARHYVFGYEQGFNMEGYVAPERRVAFFLDVAGASLMARDGQVLLDRAICWATRSCPSTVSLVINPVTPLSYCPGDSVRSTYTASGTFVGGSLQPVTPDILIDNDGRLGYANGSWDYRTGPLTGYYDRNYAVPNANPQAYWNFYWIAEIAAPGRYTVEANFPRDAAFSTNSQFIIQFANGERDTVSINQSTGTGFVSLGTYPFDQAGGRITLLAKGLDGRTVTADLIRLRAASLDPLDANYFTLELSDVNGRFASPKVLGRVRRTASGEVKGIIPFDIPTGLGYRMRVTSSNPGKLSAPNTQNIAIGGNAPTPGPIRGLATGCRGQSVQRYTIDPVPGATGYVWVTPLGTYITGAPANSPSEWSTTNTSIVVDFGLATTNEIRVYARNNCGKSLLPSRLTVSLTSEGPSQPSLIGGPDTVCQALVSSYAIAPDPAARRYEWDLPAGLTTTDTTASASIRFAGATNGRLYTIRVRAIGACGAGAWRERQILVNNRLATPRITPITANATLCPGIVSYLVDPISGATAYTWQLPNGAVGTSGINTIEVTYDVATTGTISVFATTACGNTDTVEINVNQATPGKRALLLTRNRTLGPGDESIRQRLISLGYTVTVTIEADPVNNLTFCNKVIVVSPGVNNDDGIDRYANVPVPMLVNHSTDGESALGLMKMVRENRNGNTGSGSSTNQRVNIANAGHPIANGIPVNATILTGSSSRMGWGRPEPAAQSIAEVQGEPLNKAVFAYEDGDQMIGIMAPARRVGFFIYNNGLNSATPDGLTLFDNSICWLTGTCQFSLPRITGTTTAAGPFCAGQQIQVEVTTSAPFATGNQFTIQLSDRAGSFASALNLTPTTSTGSSPYTLTVTLPDTLSPGTAYQLRVSSSSPLQVGPANGVNITIRSARLTNTLIGATACSGTTLTVKLVGSQTGVTYQPRLNGANLGSPLTGTGDTLRISVPVASLNNQPDTVYVTAQAAGCPAGNLVNYALVQIRLSADTVTFRLSDATLCGPGDAVINLTGTEAGAEYQLLLNGTPQGVVLTGTGSSASLTLPQTLFPSDSFAIRVRVRLPGCDWARLADTAIVFIKAAPNVGLVAPALSPICQGAIAIVRLPGTDSTLRYQVWNGTSFISAKLRGVQNDTLRLPLQTSTITPGTYSLKIRVTRPGCADTALTQRVTLTVQPAPVLTGVLNTARACPGQPLNITLSQSETGISYQLLLNGQPVGDSTVGTGSALPFTFAGSDTVTRGTFSYRLSTQACGRVMGIDTAAVQRVPAPTRVNGLQPTDTLCLGLSYRISGLTGQPGATYVLYNGADSLAQGVNNRPEFAIGNSLLPQGLYLLSIRGRVGTCPAVGVSDTLRLFVLPRPNTRLVLSAQPVCAGTPATITLAGSQPGIGYQLLIDGQPQGSIQTGTGGDLTFTHTLVGTTQTATVRVFNRGCADTVLATSVALRSIRISPLRVSSPMLRLCQGMAVTVRLDSSITGSRYRFSLNGNLLGDSLTASGNRDSISLNLGNLAVGQYRLRVWPMGSQCTQPVRDSLLLTIEALPDSTFTLTGTTACPGERSALRLSNSQTGVMYKLLNSLGQVVDSIRGTGAALTLPVTAQSGTVYSILAKNAMCPAVRLADTAAISTYALPDTAYRQSADTLCPGNDLVVTVLRPSQPFVYVLSTPQGALLVRAASDTNALALTVPFARLRPGVNMLTLKFYNPNCRDTLRQTFTVFTQRDITQTVPAQKDSLCPGERGFVSVPSTQLGVRYSVINASGQVLRSAMGTGGTVRFAFFADSLPVGLNVLRIEAQRPGCPEVTLPGTATLLTYPRIDTAVQVTGGNYCLNDSLYVTLRNAQPGVRYSLFDSAKALKPRRVTMNGDIIFTLTRKELRRDTVDLRIVAQIGDCPAITLPQPARLAVRRAFVDKVTITGESAICLNHKGDYEVDLTAYTNPTSMVWKLPKGAEYISGAGTVSIRLKYSEFPQTIDSLVFISNAGCGVVRGKLIMNLTPGCEQMFIPNIFTPLSGDQNMVWDLRGLEAYKEFELKVFNAWGGIVHEQRGSYTPWDGTLNGQPLPSATYYYVLNLAPDTKPMTGSITIIR